jgi:hypothetical protein
MHKQLYRTGLLAYLTMVILSLLFYKERIILLDTAYNLFHICRTGGFMLIASRFGCLVTQLLPVMAAKLHAPLNGIAISYSVGFVIYYFACYLICGFGLRQYDLALVMLLFHCLFVTQTFYYIPSELPQGLDYFLLVLAYSRNVGAGQELPPGRLALIFVLSFIAAFFHPLMLVVFAFAAGYFYLFHRAPKSRLQYGLLTSGFLAGLLVKDLFFSIPYDRQAASGLKNFTRLFPHYFSTYSDSFLLHACITSYYWIPLLIVAITIHYASAKQYRQLAWFLVCTLGYIAIVNISYPGRDTPTLYFENQYLPLGMILGLPFTVDVLPALQRRKLAMPVFAMILLTFAVRIYATHSSFTSRIAYERDYLDRYADRKMITKATSADTAALQMLWGTPYEFWLLSTTERGRTASIIIDPDPAARSWATTKNKDLLVNWNFYNYHDLPRQYFVLTDTTSGYLIQK